MTNTAILYKLTDQKWYTRNGFPNATKWGPGVEHSAIGPENGPLCSDSWIHAYTDPLLAVLFNPIHADIDNPLMWEAEGEIRKQDGFKAGCRTLKTIRLIDIPVISVPQRVAFAILCAQQTDYSDDKWLQWADEWLSGRDRSEATACAAMQATAHAAANGAYAANAAHTAAHTAANATAHAAAYAALAANAANYAVKIKHLDFVDIARRATEQK